MGVVTSLQWSAVGSVADGVSLLVTQYLKTGLQNFDICW